MVKLQGDPMEFCLSLDYFVYFFFFVSSILIVYFAIPFVINSMESIALLETVNLCTLFEEIMGSDLK